jgi:DNA-binding transcriptional LysR family regulator
MAKAIDWESRIGRRVRLRDLHILLTVAQRGSMAKAAIYLGVSQPAISEAVADLEATLGVRLLDRNRRGIEPTTYGATLLRYGRAAFEELREGVRAIEFLADPTAGELRIACPKSISAGPLVPIIERLTDRYPRMRLFVEQFSTTTTEFPELYNRQVDLVLARLTPIAATKRVGELSIEVLFDDRFCLAASANGPWARRRKIDLAELVGEPWIMAPLDSPGGAAVIAAFRAQGLEMPQITLTSYSVHLRNRLVANGGFLTALPASILRLNSTLLHELPIKLPMPRWPVAIVTLKNRSPNPAVKLFAECARAVAKQDDRGKDWPKRFLRT